MVLKKIKYVFFCELFQRFRDHLLNEMIFNLIFLNRTIYFSYHKLLDYQNLNKNVLIFICLKSNN